jgi:hypothetical protein
MYSWIGFSPTDNGFVLAASRRVLAGQVPHAEFVWVRPAGSALLHTPIVLLFDDATLWVSRGVSILQYTVISLAWAEMARESFDWPDSDFDVAALVVLTVPFSINRFLLGAWYTVDGLLLVSLGAWALLIAERRNVGLVLIGAAPLCKQSFLPLVVAALLVTGTWRQWRSVVAVTIPALLYVAVVTVAGGAGAMIHQLTAYGTGTTFSTGIVPYLWGESGTVTGFGLFLGHFLGTVAIGSVFQRTDDDRWSGIDVIEIKQGVRAAAAIGLLGVPMCASIVLATVPDYYSWPSSWVIPFFVFGVTAGLGLVALRRDPFSTRARTVVLAVATLWAISLSVGYNAPAIGAGIGITVIVATSMSTLTNISTRIPADTPGVTLPEKIRPSRRTVTLLLIVMLVFPTYVAFDDVRRDTVYRDRAASELDEPVGPVMTGGTGLRTNANTARYLEDLQTAVKRSERYGDRYAVLPATAAYWVASTQPNPLPVDWAQGTELPSTGTRDRVRRSLVTQSDELVVIVSKYSPTSVQNGNESTSPYYVYGRDRVAATPGYEVVAETEYFVLYA